MNASDNFRAKIAWHEVVVAFGRQCAYCDRRPQIMTRDHIFPRAECGPDETWNLIPSCGTCNARRADKPIRAWLATLHGPVREMTLDRVARAESVWGVGWSVSRDPAPTISPTKTARAQAHAAKTAREQAAKVERVRAKAVRHAAHMAAQANRKHTVMRFAIRALMAEAARNDYAREALAKIEAYAPEFLSAAFLGEP